MTKPAINTKKQTALSTLRIIGATALAGGALATGIGAALFGGVSLFTAVAVFAMSAGICALPVAIFHLSPVTEANHYRTQAKTAALCSLAALGLVHGGGGALDARNELHGALRAAATQAFQPVIAGEKAARRAILPDSHAIAAMRPGRASRI